MGGSIGLAFIGFLLAWFFYIKRPDLPERIGSKVKSLYRILLNKYYIDELYDAVFVHPIRKFSEKLWSIFDDIFIDGTVNGTARIVSLFSGLGTRLQTGHAQSYIIIILLGTVAILWYCLF
jgi:NADH-quinone oxidoreductase subunit L